MVEMSWVKRFGKSHSWKINRRRNQFSYNRYVSSCHQWRLENVRKGKNLNEITTLPIRFRLSKNLVVCIKTGLHCPNWQPHQINDRLLTSTRFFVCFTVVCFSLENLWHPVTLYTCRKEKRAWRCLCSWISSPSSPLYWTPEIKARGIYYSH